MKIKSCTRLGWALGADVVWNTVTVGDWAMWRLQRLGRAMERRAWR